MPMESQSYRKMVAWFQTVAAADLGVKGRRGKEATGKEDEQELYYYVPTNTEEDAWQVATGPDLPLRSSAGEEVTEEA